MKSFNSSSMDSLPSLPLQMLNDRVSRHMLSPIGKLIKIDHKSKEMSAGLFACFWVEVNVIQPLERKLKYFDERFFYERLPHYENITNICFRCGSQLHNFDSCMFNSKSIALKIEKSHEVSQVDESLGLCMEGNTDTQHVPWVEIPMKRALSLFATKARS